MREYLNSPPDLEGNHLTAGRDLCVVFFQEAGFRRIAEAEAEAFSELSEIVGTADAG